MGGTKRIALLSILVSAALVLHMAEGFLPIPYIAPGVKLGLANMVSLMAIILFGAKEALIVVLLRTFLGSLLSGALSGFFFSSAGGILSTLTMYSMHRWAKDRFSLIGISVAGAITHNIGQLFVAGLIIENFGLYIYLPVLTLSAVISGAFIGITAGYLIPFIESKTFL